MKDLSGELPQGWEACRNYANNMVYYVNQGTKASTYTRPGSRKVLPYVGLLAGQEAGEKPACQVTCEV
jgi:hypothetical protein